MKKAVAAICTCGGMAAICAILTAVLVTTSSAMVIVADGRPNALIVLPADPTEQETAAAEDLQTYVKQISGAAVEIVAESELPDGNAVMIGRTDFALERVADQLTREHLGYEGFVTRTIGNRLVLVGMSVFPYRVPRTQRHSGDGTRHAVFDLLERFGCRFFALHSDGEHVPTRKTVSIEALDVTSKPDFEFRRLSFSVLGQMPESLAAKWAAWSIKNRLGGPFITCSHSYSRYTHSPIPRNEKRSLLESHPEFFALVPNDEGVLTRMIDKQLCLSNPGLLKRTIDAARAYLLRTHNGRIMPVYSLSPNDLRDGWCECENCRAWDDPDDTVGLATRVLRFNNLVAEALQDEFPDRRFPYYAEYSNMPGPPVRQDGTIAMKAHPAVLPVYVNIYCLIHDINDPSCPGNVEHRRRIDQWGRVADSIYMYEWFMWTSINPLPVNYAIGQRIRYYRDHGVTGYLGELIGHSPDNMLSMYLASKMLWDTDQDPDVLLDEFHDLYYQEASEPMRRYYRILNEAALQSNSHGCRFLALRPDTRLNVDHLMGKARVSRLKHELAAAVSSASQPVIKRRLARDRVALELYDLEAQMLALHADCLDTRALESTEVLRRVLEQYRARYAAATGIVNYSSKHAATIKRIEDVLVSE